MKKISPKRSGIFNENPINLMKLLGYCFNQLLYNIFYLSEN